MGTSRWPGRWAPVTTGRHLPDRRWRFGWRTARRPGHHCRRPVASPLPTPGGRRIPRRHLVRRRTWLPRSATGGLGCFDPRRRLRRPRRCRPTRPQRPRPDRVAPDRGPVARRCRCPDAPSGCGPTSRRTPPRNPPRPTRCCRRGSGRHRGSRGGRRPRTCAGPSPMPGPRPAQGARETTSRSSTDGRRPARERCRCPSDGDAPGAPTVLRCSTAPATAWRCTSAEAAAPAGLDVPTPVGTAGSAVPVVFGRVEDAPAGAVPAAAPLSAAGSSAASLPAAGDRRRSADPPPDASVRTPEVAGPAVAGGASGRWTSAPVIPAREAREAATAASLAAAVAASAAAAGAAPVGPGVVGTRSRPDLGSRAGPSATPAERAQHHRPVPASSDGGSPSPGDGLAVVGGPGSGVGPDRTAGRRIRPVRCGLGCVVAGGVAPGFREARSRRVGRDGLRGRRRRVVGAAPHLRAGWRRGASADEAVGLGDPGRSRPDGSDRPRGTGRTSRSTRRRHRSRLRQAQRPARRGR